MFRTYVRLTKPGVMVGNLITTIAGFLFASQGNIDWMLFLTTNIGSGLIISSACVINNVLDQDIDARMERTKNRPLITGEANSVIATVFGIFLGVLGVIILSVFTNWWVVGIGIVGFITYVWLYGAMTKRRSRYGTLVGAISGAVPILAGYWAVKPTIDSAGILLFLILFIWQMPEFYSIAIYRRKEYKKAGIPVITVVKSLAFTVKSIFIFCLLFTVVSLALYGFGHTSYSYLVAMGILNVYWIWLAYTGFKTPDINYWSKHMFRYSIIVVLVFSVLISFDNVLP